MSEPTQSDAGAPAPEPIAPPPEPSSPPPASDAPITAREAADLISEQASDTQSADKADAAPPKESRGETEAQEPEESLTAPRSWPKAEREAFAALTREHQEAFLARDRAREADIQLGLKQAAEQRKAAEALAQQAEQAQAQARAAYERSLPQEVLVLEAKYREEFGTPTEAEIAEWEHTDPTRWIRWNGAFQRVTRARHELQQQQTQQAQQQWQEQQQFLKDAEAWRAEETQKFLEAAPEWKDPATYGSKVAGMMKFLQKIGFQREFLERAANEYLPIQIHDHKFQVLAWKAQQYDEAIAATKQPARASVPPVQRPGSAPNRGEAQEARLRDLNRQLDRTGSIRDGASLIAARMNGRS
jgi:hypothetical protein